ncbi:MAG: DoxX family membrane protein [Ignavibacteriae bacterium]|nr:DoxX family membrane protein [Ignavibacteria bacterium]MBI3364427.1 DoxX family membrane protein [Ignavibacteriota bacterium]
MKRILAHPYVVLLVRCFLGVVFVIAAIEKIAIPETFAISVEAYKLIPTYVINVFALVIPWVELVCGLFLIAGVFVRASSALLSGLLAVFVVALISALLRELKIDCGCFGPSHATPVGWGKVLEDVGLLVLSLYVFFVSAPKMTEDTQPSTSLPGEARVVDQ